MWFVKTKNFRINFITSYYSHCMEQEACQCFMIFIRQYFGPESYWHDRDSTYSPHNNSKSQNRRLVSVAEGFGLAELTLLKLTIIIVWKSILYCLYPLSISLFFINCGRNMFGYGKAFPTKLRKFYFLKYFLSYYVNIFSHCELFVLWAKLPDSFVLIQ